MTRNRIFRYLFLILMSFGPGHGALRADDRAATDNPAQISETQVTVLLTRSGATQQYRATVVAKDDDTLTLVSAAHCISPQDVGSTVRIGQGENGLSGVVLTAAQNPDFHPIASRDPQNKAVRGVLSVDTAVATIRVTPKSPSEGRILQTIKAATMAVSPAPGSESQTITVHILDQHGEEHVVKAGNHLNPKCLAWGHASYRPLAGDSGAGVFLMGKTPEGRPWPILIGNVALSDARGGIAPLVSRQIRWIDEAVFHTSTQQPQ